MTDTRTTAPSPVVAVALTGPTASGKTALSLSIAEALHAEILSCDSMQIYRGMDIGTAKATAAERARVPHHMIDLLTPDMPYSAESYRAQAIACAREIVARGHLPLFVGGTGLYIDTLLRPSGAGIPESDRAYRERREATLTSDEAIDALWRELAAVDPDSAAAIHKNNTRRVIRALEIYEKTGIPKSVLDARFRVPAPDIRLLHLTLDVHDREFLYRRIDRRVDEMYEAGLVREVLSLRDAGYLTEESTAAQAIGYKEILAALAEGRCAEDARDAVKLASRRYAKRQLTWFRHNHDAVRLYLDTEDGELRGRASLLDEALTAIRENLPKIIGTERNIT